MNAAQHRALEYIRNTNGGATLADFHEDHEPIGPQLWDPLLTAGLVTIDAGGKIRLTAKGTQALTSGAPQVQAGISGSTHSPRTDSGMGIANPLHPLNPASQAIYSAGDDTPSRSHCSGYSSGDSYSGSSSSSDSSSCSSSDSSSSSSSSSD